MTIYDYTIANAERMKERFFKDWSYNKIKIAGSLNLNTTRHGKIYSLLHNYFKYTTTITYIRNQIIDEILTDLDRETN